MFKKFFRKKDKEENNYHLTYSDDKFYDGIDIIKGKNFNREELVVLLSLMGVVFHKGDTEKLDKFLQEKKDSFDRARIKNKK